MISNTNKQKGVVLEALPNMHFRIKLEDGTEVNAHLAGKLRLHRIKVLLGDSVTIETNEYDKTKGRIIYRG
jgi:translation initiation factor IF-1